MAQGDFTFFNDFHDKRSEGIHVTSDTYYIAFVSNATVPSATTAAPHWGGTGTTNFATNEVSGGNFPVNGTNISSVITDNIAVTTGTETIDFDDISKTADASNPSAAYWGIIYNNTEANKQGVGFLDLGGPIDFTSNNLTITWDASGLQVTS